jgi:3alpha(or 20beta)-hydroxysteroid dehydrogenase
VSAFDLTGRRVLVTGGAQGLGEGIARALGAAGAAVMIADVAKDLGEQTAAGMGARFVALDVTDDAAWEAAVAQTVDELGGLDVVVNNAGLEVTQLLVDTDPDDVRRLLEVNLIGTMLGIKHAFSCPRRWARSLPSRPPARAVRQPRGGRRAP